MLILSSRLDFDHFTRVFSVQFLGVTTQLALDEDIWLPLNLVQLYRTLFQVSLSNMGVSPVYRGNWYQI
jgi:hypothetical protein